MWSTIIIVICQHYYITTFLLIEKCVDSLWCNNCPWVGYVAFSVSQSLSQSVIQSVMQSVMQSVRCHCCWCVVVSFFTHLFFQELFHVATSSPCNHGNPTAMVGITLLSACSTAIDQTPATDNLISPIRTLKLRTVDSHNATSSK